MRATIFLALLLALLTAAAVAAATPDPLCDDNAEAGACLAVTGLVQRSGNGFALVDGVSGVAYRLGAFEGLTEGEATISGRLVFADEDGDLTPALCPVVDEASCPGTDEPVLTTRFSSAKGMSADEPRFHESVAAEGAAFLRLYAAYRSAALDWLRGRWGSNPQSLSYETLDKLNRQAHDRNAAAYDKAMAAADRLIDALREKGRWTSVDPSATHLVIDKGTGLLSVVVTATGETVLAVPFAYGANPDGGQKRRSGDLRTPETPVELASPATTPHYVVRRSRGTVAPGMTVRCMGIGSKRAEDRSWVGGGMNVAIHGTPAAWSMGLRASHGCCRVREGHVVHVYALTATGTPIVLLGTGAAPAAKAPMASAPVPSDSLTPSFDGFELSGSLD